MLREQLQVSRGTLREALTVFEQKGLIRIQLGGGAVAQAPGSDLISDGLDLLIRSRSVSPRPLSELWEALEGGIAALSWPGEDQHEHRAESIPDNEEIRKAYLGG